MTELLTGWNELILALALFVATHMIPTRPAVRAQFVHHFGKAAYLAGYSVLSIFIFGWLIAAAGRAPYVALWPFAPWQMWIPNITMPLVCVLLTYGIAVPNPLSIASIDDEAYDPDHPGIVGVTRHPVLWAAALWALAHALPNGDLAHVILFGLLGTFSLLGIIAIDARKRRTLGAAEWRRLSRKSSLVPFAALLAGRWLPSVREVNLFRLIAAVGLYIGLLVLHEPVIGVSPFPPL